MEATTTDSLPPLIFPCPHCGKLVRVVERPTADSPRLLLDKHWRAMFAKVGRRITAKRRLCKGSWRRVPVFNPGAR